MAKSRKRKNRKRDVVPSVSGNSAGASGVAPVEKNRFGDLCLVQIDTGCFEAAGSEAFYRQAYGSDLFQAGTLYIFVGTDSGLLPRYIQRQGVPAGSTYLFIEHADIYTELINSALLDEYAGAISVCSSNDYIESLSRPELAGYIFADTNLFFESVSAADAKFSPYKELSEAVQKEWIDRIWRTKVAANQRDFIEKQLENLGENQISSICLKDAFKGMTAVLLAGGPSLDEALPWIKEHRDKLVVLAISRVCRRLREVDLVPDMVFSVDPQPINYENGIDLFNFWQTTLFVNAHHVSPQLLGQWRGKSVYSGPRFPWSTPLNEETLPLANPTVSNTVFSSAVTMGFAQILLAGVDLCHSEVGQTHARGSHEYKIGNLCDAHLVKVVTNGGSLANTTADYANAMRVLSKQATDASRQGVAVMNLSLYAAAIPQIDYLSVDNICLSKQKIPATEIVARILSEESSGKRVTHYHSVLDELGRGRKILESIRIQISNAENEVMSSKAQNWEAKCSQEVLDDLNDRLKGQYADFDALVRLFFSREPRLIVDRLGPLNWDSGRNEETGPLGSLYSEALEELSRVLTQAEQRILSRIMEEREVPDFSLLTRQWEKDRVWGRGLVWEHFHLVGENVPKIIDSNALAKMKDTFDLELSDFERYYSLLEQPAIEIETARDTANDAFGCEDTLKLQNLLRLLDKKFPCFTILQPQLLSSSDGHFFSATNDSLFLNIFINSVCPPERIDLFWAVGEEEFHVYWGESKFACEMSSATNRRCGGPLPEVGKWVRLLISQELIDFDLDGVEGFCVTSDKGHVFWDVSKNFPPVSEAIHATDRDVFSMEADSRCIGEGWDWLGPKQGEGIVACQYFDNGLDPVSVTEGDSFSIQIKLSAKKPPRALMFQFHTQDWEHRAYWGSEDIPVGGVEDADCRRRVGDMPQTGDWINLEVSAASLGLEKKRVDGFSVILFDGQGWWGGVGVCSLSGETKEWFGAALPSGSRMRGFAYELDRDIPMEARNLQNLIHGYMAELENKPEEALGEYQRLIDSCTDKLILENALNRTLKISSDSQDYENCLLALQCLASLYVKYGPSYANMLVVVGEYGAAINEYINYLEAVPDDCDAMLALGQVYLQAGCAEAARMAYQHVLENNPGHQQANDLLSGLEA